MSSPTLSITRWHRLGQCRTAVEQRQPWWAALGTATAAGYTLGGTFVPWSHLDEYQDWLRWQPGSAQGHAVERLINRLGRVPAWLKNIAEPFYWWFTSG